MTAGPERRLTIQPAGIPSATVAVPVVAFSSNLSAVMKSTGRVILTLFFSALAIRSLTMLAPSSSYRDVPIWRKERYMKLSPEISSKMLEKKKKKNTV